MTRKQRRFIYEGSALGAASALMALFVVPALINSRDTVAFFAGGMLAIGTLAWGIYYLYRLSEEN